MSGEITSINYCPVKSVSFQPIRKCEIKKDIGIVGDRIFAFTKDLDLEQAKLFEKRPDERKGKWNKVLTLKNSPVLNKYNFIFNNEKLTLTLKDKEILTININQSNEREALSKKISPVRVLTTSSVRVAPTNRSNLSFLTFKILVTPKASNKSVLVE